MSAVRRILTWLLLGAVVALGAAAGIDALRGGEPKRAERRSATPARAETTTGPASPEAAVAVALREAGISGISSSATRTARPTRCRFLT